MSYLGGHGALLANFEIEGRPRAENGTIGTGRTQTHIERPRPREGRKSPSPKCPWLPPEAAGVLKPPKVRSARWREGVPSYIMLPRVGPRVMAEAHPDRVGRRLAAIVAADVAGYSC